MEQGWGILQVEHPPAEASWRNPNVYYDARGPPSPSRTRAGSCYGSDRLHCLSPNETHIPVGLHEQHNNAVGFMPSGFPKRMVCHGWVPMTSVESSSSGYTGQIRVNSRRWAAARQRKSVIPTRGNPAKATVGATGDHRPQTGQGEAGGRAESSSGGCTGQISVNCASVGGGTAARERDPHTGQPCKGHRRRDGRPETANGARRSRRKGGVQFRRVHGLD